MFGTIWVFIYTLYAFQNAYAQSDDCGGDLPADPPSDIYAPDTDGDFKYEINIECVWTITANVNQIIEIQFYYMEVEDSAGCIYDYVEIYDGDFLIGKYCGFDTPGIVLSQGNEVTVVFHSDASENYYGFGLIYFPKANLGGLSLCGPIATSLAGVLTSVDDDSDGYYDNNVTCTWKIRIPYGEKKVQLYMTKMALQQSDNCSADNVKVYDARTVFGLHCGSQLPPLVTSTANDLYVDFQSDDDLNDKGFEAVFVAIDEDLQCGQILTDPFGMVVSTDRDEDGDYDDDLECVWVIVAPENTAVQMDFNDLNIEEDDECLFDYVEVRDGSFDDDGFIGRYCGSEIPGTIVSATNVIYLHFHSDDSVGFAGFNATYQHIAGQDFCSPLLTNLAGKIQSFDSDDDGYYDDGVSCRWKIMSVINTTIEVYLEVLDIPSDEDCGTDRVEVLGDDVTYGVFCGTNQTHYVMSTSNMLYIYFFTDDSINGKGFTAFYTTTDKAQQWGGILTAPTGTIQSVDSDGNGNYDGNVKCVWTIIAPEDKRIKLKFLDFDVEYDPMCIYDFLKLHDGVFGSGSSTDRLCGDALPQPMKTRSNVLYVEFQSDSYVEFHSGASKSEKGFTATYVHIDTTEVTTSETAGSTTSGAYVTESTQTPTTIGTPTVETETSESVTSTDEPSRQTTHKVSTQTTTKPMTEVSTSETNEMFTSTVQRTSKTNQSTSKTITTVSKTSHIVTEKTTGGAVKSTSFETANITVGSTSKAAEKSTAAKTSASVTGDKMSTHTSGRLTTDMDGMSTEIVTEPSPNITRMSTREAATASQHFSTTGNASSTQEASGTRVTTSLPAETTVVSALSYPDLVKWHSFVVCFSSSLLIHNL